METCAKWVTIKYNENICYDMQPTLPPVGKQVVFYKKGYAGPMSTDYFISKMVLHNDMPVIDGMSNIDKKAAHTRDFSHELAVHTMLCHNSK